MMTKRNYSIVFIAVTVLLDTIGFGLIIPVLPTLLVELTGRTVSEVAVQGGWLAFVYAALQFLGAPTLGNLSDRFGRRPVLLFAIGALGVDYMIMGFAPSLAWLFVGRAIAGLAGASFTPAYAYVADTSAPENRARGFGVVSAMFGVGFILGPAIGGFLGAFGSRAPFFAAAALSSVNFVYGAIFLRESLPPERRRPFSWKRANPIGMLLQLRRHHPEVLGLISALSLWMLANQVMPATWTFFTKFRFDWSEARNGASLALAGLMMALAQAAFVPFLVPRLGERRTALMCIVIGAIGFVGFGTATASWMLFAWLGTWLFGAIVMPTLNAIMSHHVQHDEQGELQGAVASLYSLSSMVGPPLMTHLFSRFSAPDARWHVPGAAFFAAATLAMTAFLVLIAVTKPSSSRA